MADKRKLQAEIDRCLKKITEGLNDFDETWIKINDLPSGTQKDKMEAELKTKIKRLQRLRDQIKLWCSSNDVKDKSVLMDFRRSIEERMEKFKIVEKETKTKAYSKEGLGNKEKIDPATKEKDDTINWLREHIETLSIQNERHESELEKLHDTGKRKKADREKRLQEEEAKSKLERNTRHVNVLQTIMRKLTNDELESSLVQNIKQDVDYYVEENEADDFIESEGIYDELELDEVNVYFQGPSNDDDIMSSAPTSNGHSKKSNKNSNGEKRSRSHSTNSTSESEQPKSSKGSKVHGQNGRVVLPTTTPVAALPSQPVTPISPQPAPAPVKSAWNGLPWSNTPAPAAALPATNAWTGKQSSTIEPASSTESETRTTDVCSSGSEPVLNEPAAPLPSEPARSPSPEVFSSVPSTINGTEVQEAPLEEKVIEAPERQSSQPAEEVHVAPNHYDEPTLGLESLRSMAQSIAQQHQQLNGTIPPNPVVGSLPVSSSGISLTAESLAAMMPPETPQQPSEPRRPVKISPIDGIAPLGPVPLQRTQMYQMAMLDAVHEHMPSPSDSEKLRFHLPRNPIPTPSYYPQSVPSTADNDEFFMRFNVDTLFFIFYYMEGTKAQYLAAKALKRMSWRFHTQFKRWFQRLTTPNEIQEEYEMGTYIFFDYEKWEQSKKDQFVFEYRFLEDRDLN